MEIDSLTGASCAEMSADCLALRRGCRDRMPESRAGKVKWRIPRRRRGSYSPALLNPRNMTSMEPMTVARRRLPWRLDAIGR